MKIKTIFLSIIILSLFSCSTVKQVPVREEIVYHYVDSLRIKDSTVIIPKEVIKDYVMIPDTLIMENGVALSKSYVDTLNNILKGTLTSKDTIKYKYVVQEKTIKQIDSIYIEKPVEVVKEITKAPKILWWSLAINALILIFIIIKIYFKLK